MTTENNVFIVNKQELIHAALETEKQDTLASLILLQCVDQLEDICRKLNMLLEHNHMGRARGAFLNLFMNNEEWGKIITDDLIEQWQKEFETNSFQ